MNSSRTYNFLRPRMQETKCPYIFGTYCWHYLLLNPQIVEHLTCPARLNSYTNYNTEKSWLPNFLVSFPDLFSIFHAYIILKLITLTALWRTNFFKLNTSSLSVADIRKAWYIFGSCLKIWILKHLLYFYNNKKLI